MRRNRFYVSLFFCGALYRALQSIAKESKTCFLFPDQEKNAVEAFHDWFQWDRYTLSQAWGSRLKVRSASSAAE